MTLSLPKDAAAPQEPRVLLVLGPWSCGSTALTGWLARMGAWSCPPHQATNDPLTPDSHEPKALRDALCATFHELTLAPIGPVSAFSAFFGPWLAAERQKARSQGLPAVVLKHPILSLVLPQVLSACDARILVCLRPMDQIEASRQRRRWHPVYGRDGAQRLYGSIFSTLIAMGRGFQAVSYSEFLARPGLRQRLARDCGLPFDATRLAAADAWLRPSRPPAPGRTEDQTETSHVR